MAPRRRALPVKLSDGECYCPRKSAGCVPAIISVSSCKMLHTASPEACARHECQAHIRANREVEFLRKHSDAVDHLFYGAGSATADGGKSDGEDTAADAV